VVKTAAAAARAAAGALRRESVLCVPRTTIFPDGAWHGLVPTGLERVLRTIRATAEYRPRHLVEEDPSQQQIIPYCIVRHPDDTYLLTHRLRASTEKRLHHLYSLGVGGHVNPGDGEVADDPVVGGLRREWAEEIVCAVPATARLVALLNDDTTPVSRVHLGLVFLVEPRAGAEASVREVEKLDGEVLSLEAMRRHYLNMESWSQLVYDDLVAGAPDRAGHSPLVVELEAAP
jgi:predicted NUDIX family phosphoesterase